ncbi:MAG TPA: hypothetical protein VL970_13055 [Candidatus Acidoferrales bacterium]|nr:hypothetical protein [Candidatus Acidoferrales bacterium]
MIGLACPVLLVAFFYLEEDWRGWHAWHKFKHQCEVQGERFDLPSVVPPPVPDDQNFAMTPIVVSCYGQMLDATGHEINPRNTNLVNRLQISCQRENEHGTPPKIGSWQKAAFTDLEPWQRYYRRLADSPSGNSDADGFPVGQQPQTPAADVLLALSKYNSVIEELREASRLPQSRFPLEYDKEDPAAILLPHLAALKRCSLVLQLRAIAELQNGSAGKALDDVKLILRLSNSIRTEPPLISQLVRLAILQIAIQPIWEGLAEHRWSEPQLADLDQALSGFDFVAGYRLAMHSEMAFQEGILRFLRRHPKQFLELMSADENRHKSEAEIFVSDCLVLHLVPGGWFYQNQLYCARAMEKYYLPLADVRQQTFAPARARQAGAAVDREFKHPGPFNLWAIMMLPGLGNSARKFAFGQCTADLARVACALERYRLALDGYPTNLEALVPRCLDHLPHDIIGGGPLNYRQTLDGRFLLYSVGWNEKDDDGELVLKKDGAVDLDQGDWVWRY